MKVTLEFGDDERMEARQAMDAGAMEACLWGLDNWLRDKQKYQDEEMVSVTEARKQIHDMMIKYAVEWSC